MIKKLIFILLCIFIVGCTCPERPTSELGKVLQGEHDLRKVTSNTGVRSEGHGSFFLISGSYNQKSESTTYVTFAWKSNTGEYIISTLPVDKIRVRFNNEYNTPTIKFKWNLGYHFKDNMEKVMKLSVIYALITCKESDWPLKIELPLNN